jgi:type I restriction enzyme S subunit
MIDGLRPYPEMKATGLTWFGNVPTHWGVRRIKTLLKEVDNRSKAGEERLLSLRMRQGLVDHIDVGGKPIPLEALIGFKIVEPGQVVMNRMRAAAGLFGVANVRGLVSPDYAVFEPKPDAYNPYLLQAFRLPSLAAVFRAESKGLGTGESGFLRLYTDRFGPIPVPHPPPDEQRLIVRFLDWHEVQAAKLIRAKRKIVALLNEQKQALIHRAVTRGLDPTVKFKPSGIPWLGDVPEGWRVSRVKTEFHCLNFRRIPLSGTERGRMVLRLYDYYGASGAIDKVDDFLFDDKLLLIAEDGANLVLRNLPLAIIAEGKFWVNNHAHILKPRRGNIRFLAAILEGLNFQPWISGAAQPKLTQDRLMGIAIAVPPAEQQQAIIESCDAATFELTRAIVSARREIDLILEFRTRLIADVVTGKLDVRALATSLPDITELEPIDEPADSEDLDEAVDDPESEEVAA